MWDVRPGLVRWGSALIAIVAIVYLFSLPPKAHEGERLEANLAFTCLLIWSLGMWAPWGRWMSLVSPGEKLGLVIQTFGWAAAGAAPITLATGRVLLSMGCVLVAGSALATWKGRAWAAWIWYAIPACLVAVAVPKAVERFIGPESALEKLGLVLSIFTGCVFWTWFVREVEAWRRRVTGPDSARMSPRTR